MLGGLMPLLMIYCVHIPENGIFYSKIKTAVHDCVSYVFNMVCPEVRNEGSTDASLADKNACIENNRVCRELHSISLSSVDELFSLWKTSFSVR